VQADKPGLARIFVQVTLGLFQLGLGLGQLPGDEVTCIGRAVIAALQVGLDEFLSRGSDNAQERGVVAEFPLSGANLLRIILVANLGGLWTNRGDNHVEVAR